MLLYILGLLIVAIGLALSIALHEIGHLVPAKLFRVRVGQYMVGFGPTLWSTRRGETEYGIKAIPLGGYISMAGMFPPAKVGTRARTARTGFMNTMVQDARDASAETIPPGEEHRTFYRLPVWKRVIIMIGGPTMNLLIAVVVFTIVLCGFGTAQISTTVGSVSQCLVAASAGTDTCAPDDPAAPAAAAGLLPGDTITAIDSTPITSWEQSTDIIRNNPGVSLTFTIERDGSTRPLIATPQKTERFVIGSDGQIQLDREGNPVTEEVGMLGFTAARKLVPQPLGAVLPAVGNNIAQVGEMILTLPARLVAVGEAAFGPGERDPNGPIGVVGVGRLAGEISTIDTIPFAERASYLLGVVGSLNIALFVFNLIPLLPLDGGHIFGALWEGLRRRVAALFNKPDPGPVDTAKMVPLTLGVVIVLGAMTVLLVYADLVKPISIL